MPYPTITEKSGSFRTFQLPETGASFRPMADNVMTEDPGWFSSDPAVQAASAPGTTPALAGDSTPAGLAPDPTEAP